MVRIVMIVSFLGLMKLSGQSDSTYHHCYFPKNSFSGVVGVSLNEHSTGIALRTYYNLNHRFCLGPEFTLFSKEQSNPELNIVGHYIIELGLIGLYPLVGWQFQFGSEADAKVSTEEINNSPLGGIGLHRNWKTWSLYLEWSQPIRVDSHDLWSLGIMKTF